ncbi:DNA methyltransferase [Streptococcus hyointestinalis]|uniref:DNA methyltransferase n=1 Tax=Streptococcus hyointestinalis TaxID=1337 RepID=UPI003D086257
MPQNFETKLQKALRMVVESFGDLYVSDGILKKDIIIADLDNYNVDLVGKVLCDTVLKEAFTETIGGMVILKINEIIQMLETDDYWSNSYTRYTNKIGLSSHGRFIDDSSEVVLDFPYKDTILKAGMSKEDVAKDDARESFLNEIVAREEIDVLLDKKVFKNVLKYDDRGASEVSEITYTDNLIIKGNNLLALHSIKERFAGKVKLIYLDPPYNTGSEDKFIYNDSFTMSSWLTFMKNRLEVAKDLLSEDGLIFVHIDVSRANSSKIKGTSMQPYLHILLDEIFGKENYIGTLHWKKKKQPSFLSRIAGVMETILIFAIDEKRIEKLSISGSTDKTKRVDNASNPESERVIFKGIEYKGKEKDTIIKAGTYKNKTMSVTYLDDVVIKGGITQNDFRALAQWRISQDKVNGYVEEKLLYINNQNTFRRYASKDELGKAKSITDLLLDWGQNQDATAEIKALFEDKVFDTPKPERLLMNLIKSHTEQGDLVLDFFMGSATTQAVAHKMNRQYIGIEQMDYVKTVSVERLKKVIEGEQGGISKDVDWKGGGSFIYAELMDKNTTFINAVLAAQSSDELKEVFNDMKNTLDFDFRVDLREVSQSLWDEELEVQKKILVQIIDKNQLYHNYSEIEDETVKSQLADSDIAFNKSFYGE